jgi:hypothetical protein
LGFCRPFNLAVSVRVLQNMCGRKAYPQQNICRYNEL